MPLEVVRDRDTLATWSIDARSCGCHTAVLAQSGSGKSFLVGRLIEELLLKTKARIVVLDPNSDFVRLPEVDEGVWTQPALTKWLFPGETAADFKSRWAQVETLVLSNRNLSGARPLRINWGGLTDRDRAAVMDLDPATQPELYWSLVLAADVARARWDEDVEADHDFEYFRGVANELCDFLLGADASEDISGNSLARSLRAGGPALPLRFRSLVDSLESFDIWRGVGDGERDLAEYLASEPTGPCARVIDLLSLETDAERLAVTARTLTTLWRAARDAYSASLRDIDDPDRRVPTILVIDEAHNIVPAQRNSPAAERVAQDVVRIAAEGRKFGLFLLVITQRPRKVDPNVLSECDALFLMKMTNDTDLTSAAEVFGFLDPVVVPRAKELKVGDVFLQGRLGGTGTVWHASPRRTVQGGRSLDDGYWTTPYVAR
jgi:uncharacterized protein